MLTLAIILFLFFEIANILYTVRFGIKTPLYQPLNYRKVRLWLRMASYIFAIIASAIYLFNGLFFVGTFVLFLPYVIEKFLYWFCRHRAIREMIDLLSDKSGKYDEFFKEKESMSYQGAKGIAPEMIDEDIKSRRMWF